MSLKLTFKITLMSDYHISAGHGKGALVDSVLLRDADGVPVIRGTTLTGLLRDGLWRLLQLPPLQKQAERMKKNHASRDDPVESVSSSYCGQYSTEANLDLCPLCRLFGTPRTPKLWHISSARPENLQVVTSGNKGADGHLVRRARISPRARRAEPRKLFSQEDGDGRLAFQFTVTWPAEDEGALDEAALLTAAARLVRQLGRSRRRGQGECLFTLIQVEGTDAITPITDDEGREDWQTPMLERFAKRWANGEPAPRSVPKVTPVISSSEANGSPVRVRLFVRTDEPVLVAKRAEAGNQFESLPFISGQVMRGALAWRAARCHDLTDQRTEVYSAFVRTFLREDVLFPDLLPAHFERATLRPTIPAPRDLVTCKVGGLDHGFWLATDEAPEECPVCSKALTEVKDFVTLLQIDWPSDRVGAHFTQKPRFNSEMHIRIDLESNRVAEGDLFGYVALEAGQYFVGDIVCANSGAWEQLQALAGIEPQKPIVLRLGKAYRRGYGQVTAWFEVVENEPDTWIRLPLEKRVRAEDKEIHLTLLTDSIIIDTWGRYAIGFNEGWLSELLGQKVRVLKAAAASCIVDGFDTNLGLPRWRDVALKAGSTVRMELASAPDLDRLHEIEQNGIGLRRNEGFGRVAFNHPVYSLCQGITSGLDLPEALRLAGSYTDTEESFRREWRRILDEQNWTQCKDERFRAVARWLHANRSTPPSTLQEQLRSLGMPSNEVIELIGGEEEYGHRYRLKPESDLLSTQKGIEVIGDVLNCLIDQFSSQQQFWPLGIEMLAERVAAAVQEEEK